MNRRLNPDKCYVIKNDVLKSGKPFQHRDGTWYMKAPGGGWTRLVRIGDDLFDKHGVCVGHIGKPEKQP